MLPELLDQHRDLVDEVVILDTGSTDGTPEWAERHGAHVFREDWSGNFAEARNRSLGFATEPWVLVLDADERIDVADHGRLRALVTQSSGREVYRLIQRTYTDDSELLDWRPLNTPHSRGRVGAYDVRLGRLFPRRPELRFEGLIHELVEPSARRAGLGLLDLDVVIHHYKEAQSPEKKASKQALYLELSRAKVAQRPQDPQAAVELAMAASAAGLHQEARDALKPYVETSGVALHLIEQLALALVHLGDVDALATLRARAAQPGGERVSGLIGTGWLRAGRAEQAEPWLRRATTHPGAAFRAFVDLGVALDALGRAEEAEAAWREAERQNPASDLPMLNRGRAARQAGRPEEAYTLLIEARRRRRDRWQTHALLAGLALEQGRYLEASDHAAEAVRLPACGPDGFLRACAASVALGRREEALGYAERAAALDPKLRSVVAQLGGAS